MPRTTSPKPISLAALQRTRSALAPGTPILATAIEVLRHFKDAAYQLRQLPKGTVGLALYPLPKGNFVGFQMCISDPDVECWYDERVQRCLCKDRSGAPIPGLQPILFCRLDLRTFRCFGSCSGNSVCRHVYTVIGARTAVTATRRNLGSQVSFRNAVDIVGSGWRERVAIFIGCACLRRT